MRIHAHLNFAAAQSCRTAFFGLRHGGYWQCLRTGMAVAILVVVHWLAGPANAAPLTPADEKSVRTVIENQLAAFARDDAAKAFSYAAPNVREATGTAIAFMDMVRRGYPVVYRPASVTFLKPDSQGDSVIQRVQMTDGSGDSWLAVYTLQRQKSRAWLITGCLVTENKGRMA